MLNLKKKATNKPNKKVGSLESSAPLNKTSAVRKNVIQFLVAYSPTLLIIKEFINKQWHILKVTSATRLFFCHKVAVDGQLINFFYLK